MIGSSRSRMLAATIAHVTYWNAWWSDFANDPSGIAPLRDAVDAACRTIGRDPTTLARTVAVLVAPLGSDARAKAAGRVDTPARSGDAVELAQWLRAFEREGVSHIQLVLDPITIPAIEAAAAILTALDSDT